MRDLGYQPYCWQRVLQLTEAETAELLALKSEEARVAWWKAKGYEEETFRACRITVGPTP